MNRVENPIKREFEYARKVSDRICDKWKEYENVQKGPKSLLSMQKNDYYCFLSRLELYGGYMFLQELRDDINLFHDLNTIFKFLYYFFFVYHCLTRISVLSSFLCAISPKIAFKGRRQ